MHNGIRVAKLCISKAWKILALGKRQIKIAAKFLHFKMVKLRCSENIMYYSIMHILPRPKVNKYTVAAYSKKFPGSGAVRSVSTSAKK